MYVRCSGAVAISRLEAVDRFTEVWNTPLKSSGETVHAEGQRETNDTTGGELPGRDKGSVDAGCRRERWNSARSGGDAVESESRKVQEAPSRTGSRTYSPESVRAPGNPAKSGTVELRVHCGKSTPKSGSSPRSNGAVRSEDDTKLTGTADEECSNYTREEYWAPSNSSFDRSAAWYMSQERGWTELCYLRIHRTCRNAEGTTRLDSGVGTNHSSECCADPTSSKGSPGESSKSAKDDSVTGSNSTWSCIAHGEATR